MRRVWVLVAVVGLAAGCSGQAMTERLPTRFKRAHDLCERATPAHVAASYPTTIAGFRGATIGTVGQTQTHRFPNLTPSDFGSWCWTGRRGHYDVYEVANEGSKQLVVSDYSEDPWVTKGVPIVP